MVDDTYDESEEQNQFFRDMTIWVHGWDCAYDPAGLAAWTSHI